MDIHDQFCGGNFALLQLAPELLDIYKSPSKDEKIEFDNAEYCYQHKVMTEKNVENTFEEIVSLSDSDHENDESSII